MGRREKRERKGRGGDCSGWEERLCEGGGKGTGMRGYVDEGVLNVKGGDEIRTAGEGVGGCEWEGGGVRKYPRKS